VVVKNGQNAFRGVSVRRRDRRIVVVNLDFGAKQHHDGTTDTTIHQSACAQFERDRKAMAFKEKCPTRATLRSRSTLLSQCRLPIFGCDCLAYKTNASRSAADGRKPFSRGISPLNEIVYKSIICCQGFGRIHKAS
jgi:hypothetical protein